jgi:hypothetical protein
MATTKRIVCLTKSRMKGGFCVAGREYNGGIIGSWIRLVNGRPGEGLSNNECLYSDWRYPQVLDIMEVTLRQHNPRGHQSENWVIEPGRLWDRIGRFDESGLSVLAEHCDALWYNGSNTQHGFNDQIPPAEMTGVRTSITLISVDELKLRVFGFQKRVQAQFEFAGEWYWLWVTDPAIEKEYLLRSDGDYRLGPSYLTISLGLPFEDYYNCCYKLVAAVYEKA